MKWFIFFYALAAPLVHAKLNVVATLPDFGSIAEIIGGDKVKVTTIARGTEDSHFVDARPSFVRVLNQAEVLIEGGAELEVGWLPPLVNAARNNKILASAPGHLILGRYIRLLEAPTGPIDRSMGDIHPFGNPHYWLDPLNGKIIAQHVAETFSTADPKNAAVYQANLKQFQTQIDAKLPDWEKKLAPFKGTKIITYHKSFEYFAERFGLVVWGQLEPKPGIEPSAVHINNLVRNAQNESVKLVVIEPYRPRKTPEHVAETLHIKLLIVPEKVNGVPDAKDYFSLFDYLVNKFAEALGSAQNASSPPK
jgi:zinc/manganese transport system substrate-binding protein